ncbi:dual specificity protein phosphatase 26 isoform X11 [Bactrocera dorsalis]|uniref:protein-serine/threonine phosphatase n=1 Tax=Bactrocera dorsalis TaxID=27457 RepID=A0ABM3JQK2_BACDO|nr:dual specificity protein phosphatase 26 isoform X11 [Bactrocera dorsalis]
MFKQRSEYSKRSWSQNCIKSCVWEAISSKLNSILPPNDKYSTNIGERYSPLYYQPTSRLDNSDQTTGRHLQRVLYYSMTPCRNLTGLRRTECALHDVDCDEVYPGIYIGDVYMGFPMVDAPTTDISRYFYVAAKFIDSAISSGGKILVHCLVGMSRSATCVLAYLMICRKMTASDAIRKVRMRREIRPNEGFLQQLADLDMELKRNKNYQY